MPRFTHLVNPDTYLPGLWDFERDLAARETWSRRLRTHMDDALRHARHGEPEATARHLEAVAPRWLAVLDALADVARPAPARTVLELVRFRDALFRGESPVVGRPPADPHEAGAGERGAEPCGPFDVFERLKRASNEWALERYGETIAALDEAAVADPAEADPVDTHSAGATRSVDRRAPGLARALAGMLAGNILDIASGEVADAAREGSAALFAIADRVSARPLGIDGRERFISLVDNMLSSVERPAVLLFADNAGMDFLLGVVPFSRELLRRGCRVTLAVNERPALNDVTLPEARDLLARLRRLDPMLDTHVDRGDLRVASTGNGTPGIDLGRVTRAVNEVRADLVVFEGQGRAIESTWGAVLDRPALRVATLKSPIVAERLGLSAFDTIVDVRAAGEPPPHLGAG